MATFRKRGDYQWQVEIRRKGYPYQTKTLETRVDAEAWARMVEHEMDRGVFIDRSEAESTTIKEALERYLNEVTVTKKGAKEETLKIGKLMRHPLSSRFIASIRPADIAAYRDEMLSAGAAASTVQKYLAILSHLYTTATREWGMGVMNPVMMVRKPKVDNARDRRLEGDEEMYLMAALADSGKGDLSNAWILPIAVIALETAMRQGELLKLEWRDVDLQDKILLVRDAKNDENRGVPLSSRAIALLQGLPRSINGRVFPTTQSAVVQSWGHAIERAQRNYKADCEKEERAALDGFLSGVRFHDLRHEAASRLFESGKFDMMEVASITGHKTLQMLKRYTHLKARDLAKKLG
ncbi:MAG: site-specific integrase [Burkholderiales bacterium]|nr:site-specific integrase [Burkholderiales bacterium]